ncbi:MAG TPA: peptidoglycan binding domain-containing protein, partial [Tissierellaceae bacterium]|nr:peptidoglycan binding domain-containing protein [Tissierellaceae bacterium]
MNIEEVEEKLEKANQWDKITIKSDTEDFLEIQADEISYEYVGSADLDSIFGKESKESWLLSFFNDSVYTTPILARYDKDQINELLSTIDELDEIPLNASITYSDSFDAFVIDPHRYGIKLNKEELLDLVTATIDNRDSELNIEKYIEEPSMFEDDESLIAAKDMANKYLELELIYDFADRKELIDGSVLKDFIAFNKAELYFDRNQVKKYVVNIARKYDTFGRNRSFRTSTDKNITIGGGSYGWAIHRDKTTDALIEHIESNENKVIEPIYSFRDLERSTNDIGSS